MNNLVRESEHRGKHTIDLQNRAIKDVSFLNKLMNNEDFAQIQILNMSGNNIDDSGAI